MAEEPLQIRSPFIGIKETQKEKQGRTLAEQKQVLAQEAIRKELKDKHTIQRMTDAHFTCLPPIYLLTKIKDRNK